MKIILLPVKILEQSWQACKETRVLSSAEILDLWKTEGWWCLVRETGSKLPELLCGSEAAELTKMTEVSVLWQQLSWCSPRSGDLPESLLLPSFQSKYQFSVTARAKIIGTTMM